MQLSGADGLRIASCVDDLTLTADVDRSAKPEAGWYRVLSDDKRLLNLCMAQCDPENSVESVLLPLADAFGTSLETVVKDGSAYRVTDLNGSSIALAVPLPGERHRPCEVVTAPLGRNRDAVVRRILGLASDMDFTIPAEAATHIHFDGANLQSAKAIKALIDVFGRYRKDLRKIVGTNRQCVRLGDWPRDVYRTVAGADFTELQWTDARERLRKAGAQKYCDFNFTNLLSDRPTKQTFEVRILPGMRDAIAALRALRLFEAFLFVCLNRDDLVSQPLPMTELLPQLELPADDLTYWRDRNGQSPRLSRFLFQQFDRE